MNKIKKLALILFIWLLGILLLSLTQSYPISISLTNATFFQIPVYFWLVIIISPFLLYIIAALSENKFVSILCAMSYYFLFFSYGLYFISHPTISDIGSSITFQEILTSSTHIGAAEISIEGYMQFPIYFIFSKMFSSILGIGPIFTLNLGFMSLISIFPIFLILFYKSRNNFASTKNYFIILALYLTLSYVFLNDQFVPQFLALIYLIILFGCYIKYRETKNRLFFVLILIFYTLTVSTHSFIFLFFLIAIVFEKIWVEYIGEKKASVISYEMITLFFIIPFIYIKIYLEAIGRAVVGESTIIFDYIFSQRSPVEGGSQIQPLYHLVPEFYDQILSFMSRGIIAGAFIIVTIGFLLYFIKKKEIFDLSIIIGSFIWFIMGLSNMVLGQRALQVAPLALSNHFKGPHRLFSFLSKIIIVIILISPSLLVANTLINESLSGERLVQDNQENIAGRFFEKHLDNETYYILTAENAYPIGINNGLRKVLLTSIITNITSPQLLDFVVYSPKLKLRSMYLNLSLPGYHQGYVVYNNKNTDIISLKTGENDF